MTGERNRGPYLGRVDSTPVRVFVDLEFDDRASAESFRADLATVLGTPGSRAIVIGHESWVAEVVEESVCA